MDTPRTEPDNQRDPVLNNDFATCGIPEAAVLGQRTPPATAVLRVMFAAVATVIFGTRLCTIHGDGSARTRRSCIADRPSRLRTFVQVVVPLLRSTIASITIFLGFWTWNDFLNPLIVLGPGNGLAVGATTR